MTPYDALRPATSPVDVAPKGDAVRATRSRARAPLYVDDPDGNAPVERWTWDVARYARSRSGDAHAASGRARAAGRRDVDLREPARRASSPRSSRPRRRAAAALERSRGSVDGGDRALDRPPAIRRRTASPVAASAGAVHGAAVAAATARLAGIAQVEPRRPSPSTCCSRVAGGSPSRGSELARPAAARACTRRPVPGRRAGAAAAPRARRSCAAPDVAARR